jgi:hypothetical protein
MTLQISTRVESIIAPHKDEPPRELNARTCTRCQRGGQRGPSAVDTKIAAQVVQIDPRSFSIPFFKPTAAAPYKLSRKSPAQRKNPRTSLTFDIHTPSLVRRNKIQD